MTIHQDGKPADVITYGYIFTLRAISGDDVVSTGGTVTYSVTSQKITYTNGSETSRSNIGWGGGPHPCRGRGSGLVGFRQRVLDQCRHKLGNRQ